jgi:hypothetical protein
MMPASSREQSPQVFNIAASRVPVKRSAMLIDKFMRDIQRSLDQQSASEESDPQDGETMKRKYAARCWLNAATCFV